MRLVVRTVSPPLTRICSAANRAVLKRVPSGTHSAKPEGAAPMAQKTVVVVVDDLTGETLPQEQGQTVRFGLDGQAYEIDLSPEHAEELRAAFRRYIDAGRRVGRQPSTRGTADRGARPRQGGPAGRHRDSAAIRAWARAHGHRVSDRGRIPTEVVQAYEAGK
jgi:hypothetical protein